jgi:hypothetical protein
MLPTLPHHLCFMRLLGKVCNRVAHLSKVQDQMIEPPAADVIEYKYRGTGAQASITSLPAQSQDKMRISVIVHFVVLSVLPLVLGEPAVTNYRCLIGSDAPKQVIQVTSMHT